ncbi:MAG TPA: dienelactone hydrolase family protein [Frankiaceae bacterium]|jgi:dienelactone hydrolase|nr:dienelactone hydrolase family protein [Frankiaceae bacterium]
MAEDPGHAHIEGFEDFAFEHDGLSHQVFMAGSGPAIVVIPEIPGIHPGVIEFAQRLVDDGYTVYLPSLFGRPGKEATTGEIARSFPRACVAREFAVLANRTSPVAHWLRSLAARAHAECGGPGVGAIGMCFTGGFALAMAVEPAVLAPVMSQPSLPLPLGARRKKSLGLDPADVAAIKGRTASGLCLLGLRFTGDKACPPERFQTLRKTFGDAFEGIEIDSSKGNPHGNKPRAHSVLTVDLVDEPGHPTRAALDRVKEFLDAQLRPAAATG